MVWCPSAALCWVGAGWEYLVPGTLDGVSVTFAFLAFRAVRMKKAPDRCYRVVWGVTGLDLTGPSSGTLREARQRLGSAPLRALFDLLRGPAVTTARHAMYWRGLLVTAIDGTTMSVADTEKVRSRYRKHRGNHGGAGYPALRLSVLLTCGTRSIIDAVFTATCIGELDQARTLTRSLRAGMLLLADRNYAAADLIKTLAATRVDLLIRCKNGRRLPVIRRYRDGSWLSTIGTVRVRVVDAQISVQTTDGIRTGGYRLITTLLDADRWSRGGGRPRCRCPPADVVAWVYGRGPVTRVAGPSGAGGRVPAQYGHLAIACLTWSGLSTP
jgi:hypothetical protein